MKEFAAIAHERDLIGAIVKRPELIYTIREQLEARDFEDYTTETMYNIILELDDKNIPIRISEIGTRMRHIDSTLANFGGEEAVRRILSDSLGMPSLVPFYTEKIKSAAFRRRVRDLAAVMADLSVNINKDDGECLNDITTSVKSLVGRLNSNVKSVSDIYSEYVSNIRNKEPIKSPKVGISDIDIKLNGIGTKRLITVAGRPGGGKTTFVVQALHNIGLQNVGATILFTMEMENSEIIEKMVSDQFGINYTDVQFRNFSEETIKKLENDNRVTKSNMYIDDTPFIDINHVVQVCRTYKRKYGELGAIGIDYLGLMNKHKQKGETTTESIGRITVTLKQLAKELDCSIFMLAQMNRENEKTSELPKMSDLRDSGNIEQDSDMVLFLHKLPDDKQDDSRYTKIQLVVAKGRKTGTCVIDLNFNGSLQRISSASVKHTGGG